MTPLRPGPSPVHRQRFASSLVATLLVLGVLACGGAEQPELPTLHAIPDFTATDQSGATLSATELYGRVWVANFIFTACPSVCPMLTSQMRNFQRRLEADNAQHGIQLVSFSVDPEADTPERLAEYAALHDANLSSWRFVTLGDHARTVELVMQGFKVRMGDRVDAVGGDQYDIMHASHFVLVDAQRRVRGYYTTDADNLERLQRDALSLVP